MVIREIANKLLELILSWLGLFRGTREDPALAPAPAEAVRQRQQVQAIADEEPEEARLTNGASGNGAGAQVETLLAGLSAADAPTRQLAAEGLAAYPTEPVIDALLRCIDDQVVEVASAACASLGQIGSRRSVPKLSEVLQNPRGFFHFATRAAAAVALGALGGSAAEATLMAGVDDPGAEVSQACVAALGRIGSEAARQKLESVAENASGFYAASVVEAARAEARRWSE